MSESFHLTKSLLSHGSPVSLHLCQGLFHTSEHFDDIWCWDRGREQREPNTIHSWAGLREVLEGTWVGKEAPEEGHLGEIGPAEGSVLLSPLPQLVESQCLSHSEEKALFEGFSVKTS